MKALDAKRRERAGAGSGAPYSLLVGLLLVGLLLAGLLSGCGGTGRDRAAAHGVTAARPVHEHVGAAGSSVRHRSTKSAAIARRHAHTQRSSAALPTAARSVSATLSTPARAPAAGPIGRFAGYGNGRIGTIGTHASIWLVWRVQHAPIQIFASNGFILVKGDGRSGRVQLSRGTYRGVRVATRKRWSIELRSHS
jgi:hypothetical protein